MLRVSCFLLLACLVVVLSTPLPRKYKDDVLRVFDKRRFREENVKDKGEGHYRRDFERPMLHKQIRPVEEVYDSVDYKRVPLGGRDDVQNAVVPFQDSSHFYIYDYTPGYQPVYYYVLPDGTVEYAYQVQPASLILPQFYPLQQALRQSAQQVVQQPTSEAGNFLEFQNKPLNAAGNIVKQVGYRAPYMVSLPFSVMDTAIQGVGLEDTRVGKFPTEILDVGKAVLDTPRQVASAAGRAPFQFSSGVAGSTGEYI